MVKKRKRKALERIVEEEVPRGHVANETSIVGRDDYGVYITDGPVKRYVPSGDDGWTTVNVGIMKIHYPPKGGY